METSPAKGVYRVVLSASATPADSRFVGNAATVVEIKVLSRINIEDAEVGTADSDQSTAAKLMKVAFPNKFDGVIEADSHQKLILKFHIRDVDSQELVTVHQAFVRLTHADSQQEIFFVAEPDVNDVYKFDLDLASKAKDLRNLSGKYTMDIIVGDAVIENPTVWHVAEFQLKFAASTSDSVSVAADMYRAKPQIKVKTLIQLLCPLKVYFSNL